ncbi:DUF2934 domain-containing protein [Magnetospirillum sp. UT-4]|uniref:DUF2934 domain-containing protein n=1 Tax=Magnetospirillum sp. UT-4 TaxID=2681467 RepID=UPI0013831326|nr:DUF2934 domain-containing protein [Magnetospirillum sp. UT-4]CAA7620468.1 conserved hypothetical protein [Magnetospirillum sp. UT-4]
MARLDSSLSLAESSALALHEAAHQLDRAADADTFLRALERNRAVWQTLRAVADRENWRVPSRRLADYALATARKMGRGCGDDTVTTLIDINRQVSAELAGGDIEHIRQRAYFIWENSGRPPGQDLDHWLMAEMDLGSGGVQSS